MRIKFMIQSKGGDIFFFKKYKFKKGDVVSPVRDLSQKREIVEVVNEIYNTNKYDLNYGPVIIQKIWLDDGQIVKDRDLVFYNESIALLAEKIKQLNNK